MRLFAVSLTVEYAATDGRLLRVFSPEGMRKKGEKKKLTVLLIFTL